MIKSQKIVVLLVNLGSPNQLTNKSIKNFLKKFLSDKRVVNLPRILWLPILFGIILPLRSRKLVEQYSKIWLNGISPLIFYTKSLCYKLKQCIPDDIIVEYAFCYSDPEIKNVLSRLHNQVDIKKLIVIPLYPQFSSTTTMPVFDQISQYYKDKFFLPEITFINRFFNSQLYIKGIVNKIRKSWQEEGRAEKIIFSYHSLPQVIIQKGDSYYEECRKTTELIIKELDLTSSDYFMTFQSKFGRQKWLLPSTIDIVKDCAKNKINSIEVVCPGFISDCLETLEEINVLNREVFLTNGGLKYSYINCLNDDDELSQALHSLVIEHI